MSASLHEEVVGAPRAVSSAAASEPVPPARACSGDLMDAIAERRHVGTCPSCAGQVRRAIHSLEWSLDAASNAYSSAPMTDAPLVECMSVSAPQDPAADRVWVDCGAAAPGGGAAQSRFGSGACLPSRLEINQDVSRHLITSTSTTSAPKPLVTSRTRTWERDSLVFVARQHGLAGTRGS